MILLIDTKEKVFGIRTKTKGFTIARHGRPFGNLWNIGWKVYLFKDWMPFFCILKYENI